MAAGTAAQSRARRTCSSSCSTTSASRSSAASAPTSPRRPSTASPPNGLRYANFHTTALCSPTRACVLTGRNHHTVRHGPHRRPRHRLPRLRRPHPAVVRAAAGDAHAPRLRRVRGRQVAPHARRTRSTSAPAATAGRSGGASSAGTASSPARPTSSSRRSSTTTTTSTRRRRTRTATTSPRTWPTAPSSSSRTSATSTSTSRGSLYLATGACHSPHQSPAEWIERYRGHFDRGWDAWREARPGPPEGRWACSREHTELSPRPEWVPAWDDLDDDERRVYARYMEAFAGFLSHADARARPASSTGSRRWASSTTRSSRPLRQRRVVGGRPDGLAQRRPGVERAAPHGRRGGSSASTRSAGPRIHNNYPWGWTVAGNTPFRRWKRETHEGGVADPLIVHWPAGIAARGEVRDAVRARGRRRCRPCSTLIGRRLPAERRRRRAEAARRA